MGCGMHAVDGSSEKARALGSSLDRYKRKKKSYAQMIEFQAVFGSGWLRLIILFRNTPQEQRAPSEPILLLE